MRPKSNITTLAILTLLTLLTWVAIETYQRFTKVDYGNIPTEVIEPINPNLDKKVIDLIQSRKSYSDDEISRFAASASAQTAQTSSPSPSPSPTTTPLSTPSASPVPTAQNQ